MRVILALLLCCLAWSAGATATEPPSKAFIDKLSALEHKSTGRIGVAVVSENGQLLLAYRADERFAMCSTFKALLGAAILSRVDARLESLDRAIAYRDADLLEYAPITRKNLAAGQMTVAELNAASIQYSDNTAANLLLNTMGGPAALTRYLRSIGDTTTRLDRNEPSLNTNLPGDPRDSSTPLAMAETLHKLVVGDVLSPASQERLKQWMFGNTTGDAKLRAGFDKSWMIGDKTGSGDNGATNDVAIVFPRGIPPFIMAVFYTGSEKANGDRNAVLADVATITRETLARGTDKASVARMK